MLVYMQKYIRLGFSTPPHRAAGGAFNAPVNNIMNNVCVSLKYRVLLLHRRGTITHIVTVVVSLSEIIIIIRLCSTNPISILSANKISSCKRCLISIFQLSLNIEVILGIVVLNIFVTVRLLMTIYVFLWVSTKIAIRGLFHHNHLFRFSASLLNYALYVGCSIRTTSCHLLNIVSDGI